MVASTCSTAFPLSSPTSAMPMAWAMSMNSSGTNLELYHQWEPHWHCDVQHYTANAMKQTHDLNTYIGLQGCAAWFCCKECYEANSGWHHNHSRCKMLSCYKKGYMLGAEQLAEASNLLLQ